MWDRKFLVGDSAYWLLIGWEEAMVQSVIFPVGCRLRLHDQGGVGSQGGSTDG